MNFQIFNGIIGKKDQLHPEAAASFDGPYTTIKLPKNFELWRFISKSDSKRLGTFWIDASSMRQIMEEFHHSGSYSQTFKQYNIRNSLAILDRWSDVEWRVKIRLTEEVIAYTGKIGIQYVFDDVKSSDLIGNRVQKRSETRRAFLDQFVIPRFYNLPDENSLAKIEHFAHI